MWLKGGSPLVLNINMKSKMQYKHQGILVLLVYKRSAWIQISQVKIKIKIKIIQKKGKVNNLTL